MIQILSATEKEAPIIQQLANAIWWATYSPILSEAQIRFMLDQIYNLENIQGQIRNNLQTYLLLQDGKKPVGFASYAVREENTAVYKLHKLYCLPETKGKGFGKCLLQEVEKRVVAQGKNILELNVNKYNPAKKFYEKMGYEIVYEEDIPIGEYWMNDYVMRKILK